MAEWSCSGLQSRVRRFDSDPSLQHLRIATYPAVLARLKSLLYPYIGKHPLGAITAQELLAPLRRRLLQNDLSARAMVFGPTKLEEPSGLEVD